MLVVVLLYEDGMFKKGKDRKDLLREITLVQWLGWLVGWLAVQSERLPVTHYDFGFNVASRKYLSKYGLKFRMRIEK